MTLTTSSSGQRGGRGGNRRRGGQGPEAERVSGGEVRGGGAVPLRRNSPGLRPPRFRRALLHGGELCFPGVPEGPALRRAARTRGQLCAEPRSEEHTSEL